MSCLVLSAQLPPIILFGFSSGSGVPRYLGGFNVELKGNDTMAGAFQYVS